MSSHALSSTWTRLSQNAEAENRKAQNKEVTIARVPAV